jgi:hypothetical protein
MLVGELLVYFTPAYIAGTLLLLGLTQQIFVRVRYTYLFCKAGGVHAARLAKDPFSALTWLWSIGWAQAQNRLLDFFLYIYQWATPESPNLVEINVTGDQRYLFTREPEHIKTILTGKFADFGKGPEFHRVWVCVRVLVLEENEWLIE